MQSPVEIQRGRQEGSTQKEDFEGQESHALTIPYDQKKVEETLAKKPTPPILSQSDRTWATAVKETNSGKKVLHVLADLDLVRS